MLAAEAGWFGKLPLVGDFASRRMADTERQAWDDWLSRCLLHSRAQLGQAWLERYLNAPVWFWLRSPADRREPWHAGTLMPSVDSAGRYYPLVVAAPLHTPPLDAPSWSRLEATQRAFADACLATLAEGHAGVEAFDAALRAAMSGGMRDTQDVRDMHDAPAPRNATTQPSRVLAWVLREFAQQLGGGSLWWTDDGRYQRSEARWPQPEAAAWLFVDDG